ncbi:MAG: hypothetical protein PHH59_14310 [Methylovulum sp.]|nr:hypothetical protein [Methylovulum sp.]MDD2725178.1 hypothetical protein [Methylovulum sp.]MDD5124389.1 hypothetical protein [Methylovulum sp.]
MLEWFVLEWFVWIIHLHDALLSMYRRILPLPVPLIKIRLLIQHNNMTT